MSFPPQTSQGFQGGAVPQSLFSQLFSQGSQNLQSALPTVGKIVAGGQGQQQDPLSLLLGQFTNNPLAAAGGLGLQNPLALLGGFGLQNPQSLITGGIMDLFRDNPQFSLFPGQQRGQQQEQRRQQ